MVFDKITSLFKKGHTDRPQVEDDATREKLFWELLANEFRGQSLLEHQDYWVKTPKEDFPIIVNREKKMYKVDPTSRRLLFLQWKPAACYVHLASVQKGLIPIDDDWCKCYLMHCDAYIGKYGDTKVFLEFDEEGNPKTHHLENKTTKTIKEVFDMKFDSPMVFDYEKFCKQCDILHLNARIEKMDNRNSDISDYTTYGI